MRRERRGEARCCNEGGSTEEKTLTDRGRQTCKEEGEKTEGRSERRNSKDTRGHGNQNTRHNKTQHKNM